jgi:quinol monooxygenase YgiN
MTQRVTTSLTIHYHVKPGMKETVLSKLKGIIDLCEQEPEFITAIIQETPEKPDEMMLYELWKGTHAEFDAVQGIKPYRKAYVADVKQYLDKIVVEWNTPIFEWGTDLTGARGN